MEIWRDIEGYEGLYQVSNYGNVKSLNYNKTGNERILKENKVRNGYCFVYLSMYGKTKGIMVHRLVAQAFIPNPLNLPEVNHRNEIKSDNYVDNLEWCTRKYNINYGTRNEHVSKRISQINKNTNEVIREWDSAMQIQRELGFNNGNICKCCKGKLKTVYGYKWKYA